MEIPKNTTQIGEIQGNQKIFIEDYVISYIKQLCRQEPDIKKRIAFYGVMRTEHEQEFFFIYGASRITIYSKNDYYLLGEDYEEIANARKQHFDEYNSIGFVTIEDELPEGIFLVCDGKEQYIKGYHIFYEKNDSMLTFLINRQSEQKEEKEEANKEYPAEDAQLIEETLKKETISMSSRDEMLRKGKSDSYGDEIKLLGLVKSVVASLLIVICVTAISTLNGFGKIESVQSYFQKAFREIKEKKIPDKEEIVSISSEVEIEKELEESTEAEVILEEKSDTEVATISNGESELMTSVSANMTDVISENEEVNNVSEVIEETVLPEIENSHIVEAGETLISISKDFYGDDSKVKMICELNGITNSDNIQVGQKIILP